MSIEELLKVRLDDGDLIEVTPIRGGPKGPRVVYATPQVFAQLEPTTATADYASSSGHLRRWLDGFTRGKRLVIGPRRSRSCDMKQLEPTADEVWEIRKQDQPSVRLFGRFIDKDAFVATNMELVSNLFAVEWIVRGLSRWPIWKREIRNCKAVWRRLFLTYPPHTGSSLDDYLSAADRERDL
jgi:hypothetical protein